MVSFCFVVALYLLQNLEPVFFFFNIQFSSTEELRDDQICQFIFLGGIEMSFFSRTNLVVLNFLEVGCLGIKNVVL